MSRRFSAFVGGLVVGTGVYICMRRASSPRVFLPLFVRVKVLHAQVMYYSGHNLMHGRRPPTRLAAIGRSPAATDQR